MNIVVPYEAQAPNDRFEAPLTTMETTLLSTLQVRTYRMRHLEWERIQRNRTALDTGHLKLPDVGSSSDGLCCVAL